MQPVEVEQTPSFVRRRPAVADAYAFAARCHSGQRRESDAAAFIVHPLEVGALLDAAGSGDDVIVAGVLHDVLEKTAATPADLHRVFGDRIAGLVLALTEDPRIEPFETRKAALRAQIAAAGPAAGEISAADHVAKLRELRTRIAKARAGGHADPADGARKVGHYRASLDALEDQIPDHPLVRQLRFELEALDVLPPGRGPAVAGRRPGGRGPTGSAG